LRRPAGWHRELAGSASVELAGSEGLSDVGEGCAHGVEVVEGLDFEPVRLVVAKGAGATQTSSPLHEVVIAVFAIPQSGRAAVDSVFFDVTTSFILHKARFPFVNAVPLPPFLKIRGLLHDWL